MLFELYPGSSWAVFAYAIVLVLLGILLHTSLFQLCSMLIKISSFSLFVGAPASPFISATPLTCCSIHSAQFFQPNSPPSAHAYAIRWKKIQWMGVWRIKTVGNGGSFDGRLRFAAGETVIQCPQCLHGVAAVADLWLVQILQHCVCLRLAIVA